jgi:hypothetical protein
MSRTAGWSEDEARAAVTAYFNLLAAEREGRRTNKLELYRELSERFPNRVPKAFELKFQNISAIMYEQRLPYCSGLKPRFNYQRLLKLLVLDKLDRSPLPPVEPHVILFAKLRELSARGPFRVTKKGAGRFGLAIETALGIPQNSDKAPDFMGIELKTKSDGSLQTLFSRTPSRYVSQKDKTSMFNRHCRLDRKRGRRSLYTSFNNKSDSWGFRLDVHNQVIRILRGRTTILEYDAEQIEEALLSKHTQTVYVSVTRGYEKAHEICAVESAQYCKWPSVLRFIGLILTGDIFFNFMMSEDGRGRIKDHGFLWRIRQEALPKLYLSNRSADLRGSTDIPR